MKGDSITVMVLFCMSVLPDSVSEFRTDYWGHLVEKVTVHRKGTMTFSFACGVEIQI